MPYASDSEVPSYVASGKRAQWRNVWNSAYDRALKSGKSAKDAEATAFAEANGVAKKESAAMFGFLKFDIARVVEGHLPMNQTHDALRGHLRNALSAAHNVDPNGSWSTNPWVIDTFPDHVVYQHNGQTLSRSYTANYPSQGADPTIKLGQPKTVHRAYVQTRGGNAEQGRAAEESEAIFMDAEDEPAMERFISKAERDETPSEDFAGKGTSYPIKKPGDVKAALDSIGRAGADNYDGKTLKANILRIAKRKGFPIPKSDQSESVTVTLPEGSELVTESAVLDAITKGGKVKEAISKIPVKIIGPGWGSMAYYPKEVLQRDGPKVYTKGTQMFWNHATEASEQARPEGDLNDLAAVLTKDAYWDQQGPKGPGLYSEAKVFSDYADQVREKGGHIGVSINAAIRGREGEMEGRRGRIAEGLVKAFSVDFVTKAGAGGAPVVPVTESSRGQEQERTMTEQEQLALQNENKTLKERLAKVEESQNHVLAIATVGAILKEAGIRFSRPLLERACEHPVMKESKVDADWAKNVAKDFAEAGGGHDGVRDFSFHGREAGVDEAKDKEVSDKQLRESLKSLGVPEKGLDFAVAGRV